MNFRTTPPLVTELPLHAGVWALDPDHSSVGFAIRHLGVSSIRGRFSRFTASMTVGSALNEIALNATIDTTSIDTGNAARDAHLCSPELIDVARRPTMTYRSTGVVRNDSRWCVSGRLTFGDIVCPLDLDVEFGGVESYFDGTRHAGFSAVGAARRSELGITLPHAGNAMLGDVVHLQFDIQMIEPS